MKSSEETFVVNAQIAVVNRGKLLLIRRSANKVQAAGADDLPGGKLELSELGNDTLEVLALRELQEETGLRIGELPSYVCSSMFIAEDSTPVLNVVMMVLLDLDECPQVRPGIEEQQAFWIEISDALVRQTVPSWTKEYISRVCTRI